MIAAGSLRALAICLSFVVSSVPNLAAMGAREAVRTVDIRIDETRTYQRIEHFGVSAAWWAQDVGAWPPAVRDAILDLLFDAEKGIGLNLIRYNIGGGKAQSGAIDPWRSAESPYRPDGSLDWSADRYAMSIVDGAVLRGARVLLFANSPPAGLTVTGSPTGNAGSCNLLPGARDDFSRFLAACVADLRGRWPLVAISPINEPQWEWRPSKGQEGCFYTPDDAAALIESMVGIFSETGISLPLSVIDSARWGLADNRRFLDALLARPDIARAMTHYAVHSYGSTGKDRGDLVAYLAGKAPGLPIWQTEWTEMREGRDPGMRAALVLADTLHEDVCVGNVVSWQYWIALSKYRFSDGLIYVDEKTGSFETTKKLYALGNWSKFIRPGAVRLACDPDRRSGLKVSAFRNPDGAVILVLINGDDAPSSAARLLWSGGRAVEGSLVLWETSEGRDLVPRDADGGEAIRFAARSVTTVVIERP